MEIFPLGLSLGGGCWSHGDDRPVSHRHREDPPAIEPCRLQVRPARADGADSVFDVGVSVQGEQEVVSFPRVPRRLPRRLRSHPVVRFILWRVRVQQKGADVAAPAAVREKRGRKGRSFFRLAWQPHCCSFGWPSGQLHCCPCGKLSWRLYCCSFGRPS